MEMKIKPKKIRVRDLIDGYESYDDGRVVGWGGKLDIRPPYQREFIHENNSEFKKNLIHSIYQNRPINLIYFAKREANSYELLDGQQRVLTICKYVEDQEFAIEIDGKTCYFDQLAAEKRKADRIMEYKLHVHICTGGRDELMKWFQTINTGAEALSDQELRNALYNGSWVTSAKRWFTRTGNQAKMCARYMDGKRNRQEHLERIIQWKTGSTKDEVIRDFMAKHEEEESAEDLWKYFREVSRWIESIFTPHKKSMDKHNWGNLHREFSNNIYDPDYTKRRQEELLNDPEVQKDSGVYQYILSGEGRSNRKYLHLRTFSKTIKKKFLKKQGWKCATESCQKEIDEHTGHADHKTPWSEGGKTEEDNCQILCLECNLQKSNKQ